VSPSRTPSRDERTLTRYGADRFAYFVERKDAVVIFEAHGRRLRFNLPLQEGTSAKAGAILAKAMI